MRPIIDAHLDLAWNALHWNRDLTLPLQELNASEADCTDHRARGRATVSLPEMRRARIGVCLATVLVRANPTIVPAGGAARRDIDYRTQTIASAAGRGQRAYYKLLERQGLIRSILTSEDLEAHWQDWMRDPAAPLGVILAMEGADPIFDPTEAADWFADGLRCVGLAHYGPGAYAFGTGASGPLTPAGRELLRNLDALGMILDLTHCAEPGFFEALDRFSGPVHASHNMCRSLVPGDRQFSDDQIRRLIERDAVIGMALDAWMLHPGWVRGESSPDLVPIERVADHIDYICQLAGSARVVGIGSDLDGGYGTEQCPRDFHSIVELHQLESILLSRGYTDDDLDAIFFGNWLRFFVKSLPKHSPSGDSSGRDPAPADAAGREQRTAK